MKINGILCLDKPAGITSFSACNVTRKLLNADKAGHTGTLDPMATGVLPLFLGAATRFIGLLPDTDKAYEARFITGKTTDTLDITGTVTSASGKSASLQEILSVLPRFTGVISQIPPMYSAIKIGGVRLYALARAGEETPREARQVTVSALTVAEADNGEFSMSINCSGGTYVRSVIAAIGDTLGCGAVMTFLRRTRANGYTVSDCRTLDELRTQKTEKIPLLPLDSAFAAFPALKVTEAQSVRFKNGGELLRSRLNASSEGLLRVYAPDERFLGLGEILPAGESLTVKRIYIG